MVVQEHQETTPLLALVGEQLRTDYQLHDLPTVSKEDEEANVLLSLPSISLPELKYWGEKDYERKQQRKRKLNSQDQFFLTMTKLKLNLRNKDLGYRFGISESLVSRYICTWICFLYQHLKEID